MWLKASPQTLQQKDDMWPCMGDFWWGQSTALAPWLRMWEACPLLAPAPVPLAPIICPPFSTPIMSMLFSFEQFGLTGARGWAPLLEEVDPLWPPPLSTFTCLEGPRDPGSLSLFSTPWLWGRLDVWGPSWGYSFPTRGGVNMFSGVLQEPWLRSWSSTWLARRSLLSLIWIGMRSSCPMLGLHSRLGCSPSSSSNSAMDGRSENTTVEAKMKILHFFKHNFDHGKAQHSVKKCGVKLTSFLAETIRKCFW